MCRLNIIVKKRHDNSNHAGILQWATGSAWLDGNDDGEGAYFNGTDHTVRSNQKLDYHHYRRDIRDSTVIITHQRLATSGFSKAYHHPFESERWIFAHNGVVMQYAKDKHSDSAGLFTTLRSEFTKAKGNTEERTIAAIKAVFNDLNGSWSVVLYNKKKRVLYYWKNSSTRITFRKGSFLYIGTEDMERILPDDMKELKIDDLTIYRIGEDMDPIRVGELSGYTPKFRDLSNFDWSGWKGMNTSAQRATIADDDDDTAIPEEDLITICSRCQLPTIETIYNEVYEDFVCHRCDGGPRENTQEENP